MAPANTPARQRRPREEAIRMGKEIYRETILPQVEGEARRVGGYWTHSG